ncbi:hypothetical protein SETIT_9G390300v2 [Setaria italica]|uniref:Helitron helicase-like domain-containing protein n=1 Tax=Setaria italica TaxID=4555 RepID=A0A368SQC3_SETIT|nr:hypothetical protein SETIT_9G390300v2 [Setaria italica]
MQRNSLAESPSQLLDPKEQRRKRDRDRYARMTDQEKQEKLKKRREAYHQQKRTKKQQKIHKKCMHERERYANMQPNQKKAKLEQVSANRARQRDTLSKKSIAMENPANHPKHLELYFYDDDPTLEHRYRYCRKEMYEQDKHVLLIITNTLRNNPYSEQFRSLGQEENLEDYRVMLNLDQRLDQRTYNAPITSEVAAVWIEGNERRNTFDRNVILHGNNNKIQGIRSYTGCYDPLSYPLFFPRGELGWHADIPKVGITTEDVKKARANQNNKNNDPDSSGRMWVTMREYYCYKFHVRANIFNPILYGGWLFQQFAVDTYIKIESSQLDFIWNHQKEIRADLYQGLLDSIHAGQDRGDAVGKRTVLSSSFIGGPRDKMRRYLDAMALVRKYGKPDIFLTMTCNPNWEEITNELEAKLEQMKKQLLEEHILGKVKAYTYVLALEIGQPNPSDRHTTRENLLSSCSGECPGAVRAACQPI